MADQPSVAWDDPRVLASPAPEITRSYLLALARLPRWAIRCNHEDGTSHVGSPYLTDAEVAEQLRSANADAHGKTYTAETTDGQQWSEEWK